MQNSIIKGNGNSRYLKSVENFQTLYPTYEDFVKALVAGTLPIDLNGINEAGFQQLGTMWSKENVLKDETAVRHGLTADAVPDDMWDQLAPIGAVFWLASETIPVGYLKCDGSAISRTDYASLFSVIGTKFGTGDGTTTFNIPDLRAAFIRGAGSYGSYSATFAGRQSASSLCGFYSSTFLQGQVEDADYATYLASQDIANGGGSAGTGYLYRFYLRPHNIALTPIIKY